MLSYKLTVGAWPWKQQKKSQVKVHLLACSSILVNLIRQSSPHHGKDAGTHLTFIWVLWFILLFTSSEQIVLYRVETICLPYIFHIYMGVSPWTYGIERRGSLNLPEGTGVTHAAFQSMKRNGLGATSCSKGQKTMFMISVSKAFFIYHVILLIVFFI